MCQKNEKSRWTLCPRSCAVCAAQRSQKCGNQFEQQFAHLSHVHKFYNPASSPMPLEVSIIRPWHFLFVLVML